MNWIKFTIFIFLFARFCFPAHASTLNDRPDTTLAFDTINISDSVMRIFLSGGPEVVNITPEDSLKRSKFKSKKLIAAVLAFPFPFGLLGLHRVFLGTKPYIPFVYIGTLGGCFLILPIIDFIAILSANEETFKRFENNPKVFMWSH